MKVYLRKMVLFNVQYGLLGDSIDFINFFLIHPYCAISFNHTRLFEFPAATTPGIDDVPLNVHQNMILLYDGSGPHFALIVHDLLWGFLKTESLISNNVINNT